MRGEGVAWKEVRAGAWAAILATVFRDGLSEDVSELTPVEGEEPGAQEQEEEFPGQRNSKYTGPEVGKGSAGVFSREIRLGADPSSPARS